MPRLSDEEFDAWCQRNQLAPETAAYIQHLRTSPPARRTHSRASNMSGRYPSVKMGCTIQFESQHVELWGIYTMERDTDVLEFYDQPTRIPLHYQARSGRKTSPWHIPDFLVIRRDGAGFEEWKHPASLEKLAITQPQRYQRKASGGWQCPQRKLPHRPWASPIAFGPLPNFIRTSSRISSFSRIFGPTRSTWKRGKKPRSSQAWKRIPE